MDTSPESLSGSLAAIIKAYPKMKIKLLRILLADDDQDDCELFQIALNEATVAAELTTMDDGVKLMDWLNQPKGSLPDLVILDLYMPRKNGLECLMEIKAHPDLQSLPVIILSQTVNPNLADVLYENGALYYLQKPTGFQEQIRLIENLLRLPNGNKWAQPSKEAFIITAEH